MPHDARNAHIFQNGPSHLADAEEVMDNYDALWTMSDKLGAKRGKSIITTEESRTNTAYGLMPTPDKVNVVLPADGLIAVLYQGMWKESVNNTALATIFVGSNEVLMASKLLISPIAHPANLTAGAGDVYKPLCSWNGGLIGTGGNTNVYTGDVTTGQLVGVQSITTLDSVGGPCYIFAAAGTYDVSIQYKSTSGSVTVKNRKLWAWALGF